MKKFLSIVVAVFMILGTMGTVTFADAATLSGLGTETEPYLIGTADELAAFRDDVNNGNDYSGKYVKLTGDIVLSGEWTPIANGSRASKSYSGNVFKGVFDGNGAIISGLEITTAGGDNAVGFFGVVDGGTVKNFTLSDVNINTSSGNTGAAIGLMVGGAVADGITVSGSVNGPDGIGGIVGRTIICGTVSNCVNNATVTATTAAAGIVGKAYYTEVGQEMTIDSCTNNGTIRAAYAGGIVGLSASNVINCTNTAEITGSIDAGGIVAQQLAYGEVSGNTNTGLVALNNPAGSFGVGGIVGRVTAGDANSYKNQETVTVDLNNNSGIVMAGDGTYSTGNKGHAGGIVGYTYTDVIVTNNLNSAQSITSLGNAAGILGAIEYTAHNVTVSGNISTTALENITSKGNQTVDKFVVDTEDGRQDPNGIVIGNNGTAFVAQLSNGEKFTTISAAVSAAEDNDTITILTAVSDEAVNVDKNVTITGSATLNNVSVNAVSGCNVLKVSGLTFTGNSWINAGAAGELTVSDVNADVKPNNASATNSRSAFISLGRSEQHELKLVVENCNIVASGGADPILGWAAIKSADLIGNTFGSANAYQANSDSVKFMAVAEGAVFTIKNNTVYSNYNGFVFGQNTTRANAYTAIIENNTFYGGADHVWIEVSGSNTVNATILATSDNTVNGNAFTVNDIKIHPNLTTWTYYAGVDVVLDENGKIVSGTFTDASNVDDYLAEGSKFDAATGTVIPPAEIAEVNGVTYTSLQKAIDEAIDGDTVYVKEGTFTFDANEKIAVEKKINIVGAGKDKTKLVFDTANSSAITITSSNVTIKDMEINQVSTTESTHISVSKGAWDAPKVQYSNITLQNIAFTDGKYAVNAIGENLVVDSCDFKNQASDSIIVYSVRGDSKITNNNFTKATGTNKYAINFEGGVSTNLTAEQLSDFVANGTLTISGNTATDKGVFFIFNNWGYAENLELNITNNTVDAFTNKAIVFYDGAIAGETGKEFSAINITENIFVNIPEGRAVVRDERGKNALPVNASYNYWGSATPDFSVVADEGNVLILPYYVNEAKTELVSGEAEVDGIQYATLEEALKVVDAGGTVKLASDVVATTEKKLNWNGDTYYTYGISKDVTLDLAGFTLYGNAGSDANHYALFCLRSPKNSPATITIEDSSADKTGAIINAPVLTKAGKFSNVIYNNANLVLNGGTIKNEAPYDNSLAYAIESVTVGTTSIIINEGAKVISEDSVAVRVLSQGDGGVQNAQINNATITGNVNVILKNGGKDTVNFAMDGGTINGDLKVMNYFPATQGAPADSISITDGIFNGEFVVMDEVLAQTDAIVAISGGTFNSSIADEYIKDGFVAVRTGTGYVVLPESEVVEEIKVEFAPVPSDEGTKYYNINLVGENQETINRLNSADLTFKLETSSGANEYEIVAVNSEVEINAVNNSKDRYEFHFDGKDAVNDTANTITIGQVRFTGYGAFTFGVDTAAIATNAVHATKLFDNLVDTFVPNGSQGLGTLTYDVPGITTAIEVPTRELEIDICFPNAVAKKIIGYQDMTVTVAGGDLEKDIIISLGDENYEKAIEGYNERPDAKFVVAVSDCYVVTLKDILTVNNSYTVTVEGAGYRTARYTVTMTDDKELNFWNNVMDEAQVVEVGKETSKTVKNFLAGDIVADSNINIYDLSAVVSYFGTTNDTATESDYAKYDLNRDGLIDSKDVAYVLVSWGE